MEQLVARWAHNPKVVSSSLAPATPKGESRNWFSFFYALFFALQACFVQAYCFPFHGLPGMVLSSFLTPLFASDSVFS